MPLLVSAQNFCDMTFVTRKNRADIIDNNSKHEACLPLLTDTKRRQLKQEIFRSCLNSKQEMMKYFDKTLASFFDRLDCSYSVSLDCV